MPATHAETSSRGAPMYSASIAVVRWTLWHRPTVLMEVASPMAQQAMAMGLVYWSSQASGQAASMSRHTSRSTGMVRRALKTPPGPTVSPTAWSTP